MVSSCGFVLLTFSLVCRYRFVLLTYSLTGRYGFVIFWDFACGLPQQVLQCHLVYAVYEGTRQVKLAKHSQT